MRPLHIACVCDPGPSHIMNFAELDRQLRRLGHRVTFFQAAGLEPSISAAGLDFFPLPGPAPDSACESAAVSADKRGAVRRFLEYMIRNAAMFCEHALPAFKEAAVDGVVVDAYEPGGATAAEAAGLPFVTICSAVPLHAEPGVPPDFLRWRYHDAWWATLRNRFAYAVRDVCIRPLYQALNGYRRSWGLPLYHCPDDSWSPLAQISQLVSEFDFPRKRLPACFHYVGPYRRECEDDVLFPYERLDGRPLIYASLGTVLGVRQDIWDAIVHGCADLDVQLVISLGARGRAPQLSNVPSNVIVVDYAPQRRLLGRASLAITHAGLNSVMEALAVRVPLIAIPITGDQFSVAARIAYTQTGEIVAAEHCTGPAIGAAARKILSTPAYRKQASRIGDAIETTHGAVSAAAIIECAVATRSAVVRDAPVAV
jgi:zeaxanthin glucosyltransferase